MCITAENPNGNNNDEIVKENVCGISLWRVYEKGFCIGAFSRKVDAIKYAKSSK